MTGAGPTIGASYRQETIRLEISRLRFAALEMTGVGFTIGASYRQETVGEGFPMGVKHSDASYRQETIRPEISRLRFRPSK